MRAEFVIDGDGHGGPVNVLAMLCASRMDVQQTRLALTQRGLLSEAEAIGKTEDKLDRAIKRELMGHPLWPWLSQYPGVGGVQTARLISLIGDPLRFPGQKCSIGHTMAPDHEAGAPCPWVGLDDTPCEGVMLDPRTTTGVRSLWHYLGLHVVEGRSPKRRKGQRADWSPVGRTVVLMPGGIADSIIKSRTPKYRDIYDAQKERLANERGAANGGEDDELLGPAQSDDADSFRVPDPAVGVLDGPGVDRRAVGDIVLGLRPIQIHERARKIAAKAFVGDLLMEWKRLVGTDLEVVRSRGEAPTH